MRGRRVIISGGGTGGHLFPALAVGARLKEKAPDLRITYVGSGRALEKRLMAHYRADFISLRMEGIKMRGLKAIKALLLLPAAFLKSRAILRQRRPNLVIGAGGYSSGPIVLLAAWRRIPTLLMEQNRKPGFTNRLLLRWVRKAAVAFESTLLEFGEKGVYTGNPVREEFYGIPPGVRGEKLRLMVFGGSQGSRFLNRVVTEALPGLRKFGDRLVLRHQTGESDVDWVEKKYRESGFEEAEVAPFFYDMADRFRDSDLIICRAGATTVAELTAAGRAALLVPFAGAADDHQTLNALELKNAGGADILTEAEFSPMTLRNKILDFLTDPEKINRMEAALRALSKPDAAEAIVTLCLRLMEGPE